MKWVTTVRVKNVINKDVNIIKNPGKSIDKLTSIRTNKIGKPIHGIQNQYKRSKSR